MKILADGTEVSERSYHYLLDWNEQDKKEFNKNRLCDLDRSECERLFNKATTSEMFTM